MTVKERITKAALPIGAIVASIGIGFAGAASAQTAAANTASSATPAQHQRGMWGKDQMPGVFGKVTAINGTSITIEDQKPGETSATSYTVDASNAKILKAAQGAAPAESSVSAIAVGDTVAVRGTVSGTNVTATEIVDGLLAHGPGGFGKRGHGTRGTVSAVNGNTITLTGADGKTYTVDAASAQIGKISTISVGDVQVGDSLDVMGDISGTNVTAKRIMDGIPAAPQQ